MTAGAVLTTSSHYYYRDLGAPLAYPFAVLCWFDVLVTSGVERQIAAAYDPAKTGSAGIMHLGLRTGGAICVASYDDAAVVNSAFGPTYSVGTYYMACGNFAANNSRVIIVNGGTPVSQTSVRTIASPTRIGVSTRIGANNVLPFNGNVYQAAWVNRAVTDPESVALAQGMSPLELGAALIAYMPAMGLQATAALDVMTGGTFTGSGITAINDTAPPNLHHEWLV